MGHQSSSKNPIDSEHQKCSSVTLSSKFKALHDLALKHYPSKKEVEESDDDQAFFTSGGANFRQAIELTTLMALRAANEQQNLAQ